MAHKGCSNKRLLSIRARDALLHCSILGLTRWSSNTSNSANFCSDKFVSNDNINDSNFIISFRCSFNEQNSEVEAVRTAHGRRLARLKSILTSYRLVKKQLQLYEDDFIWSAVLVILGDSPLVV